MPISLIVIVGSVLYIYLISAVSKLFPKAKLPDKYDSLVFIGWPVFIILLMFLWYWLGFSYDNADDGQCVKWNYSTGECTKME